MYVCVCSESGHPLVCLRVSSCLHTGGFHVHVLLCPLHAPSKFMFTCLLRLPTLYVAACLCVVPASPPHGQSLQCVWLPSR